MARDMNILKELDKQVVCFVVVQHHLWAPNMIMRANFCNTTFDQRRRTTNTHYNYLDDARGELPDGKTRISTQFLRIFILPLFLETSDVFFTDFGVR